ncbi:hypothetical protein CEP54_001029 [Fusarium duplospermum]|uniref:Uncharacterized protein n=1 Tax=Fusarium duplospermum TaxID=1325734 RepID=A0A428R339_9HYPO|nr:hypothetical protein CEP54_001029 [Fusarium duplospermum]
MAPTTAESPLSCTDSRSQGFRWSVLSSVNCPYSVPTSDAQRPYPAPEQPGLRGKKSEGQPAYGASQLLVAWAEFPDASQALSPSPR